MADSAVSKSNSSHQGQIITPELLADFRARIGEVRAAHRPWNSEATTDTIRHFCEGIGDMNPLWNDPDYASSGPFGGIIAPPTWVYTCGVPFGGGMPGTHALFGGSDFAFIKPVHKGDGVTATIELVDLIELKGRIAETMYQQLERMVYRNHNDEVVAEAHHWALRFERDEARDRMESNGGRYKKRELQSYTPEAIKGIDQEYANETLRRDEPLYFEDVQEGQIVPSVVKGPLRLTDILAFLMGCGGPYIRAHQLSYGFRQEHPAAYSLNNIGVPDVPERVHWENEYAREIGTPAAYDYGHERPSWIAQALCNWIGDAGWLKRLRVELRGVNIVGDTTRASGRVTSKSVEDGENLVHLDVWAQSQTGEMTAKGQATVRLPSRDKA